MKIVRKRTLQINKTSISYSIISIHKKSIYSNPQFPVRKILIRSREQTAPTSLSYLPTCWPTSWRVRSNCTNLLPNFCEHYNVYVLKQRTHSSALSKHIDVNKNIVRRFVDHVCLFKMALDEKHKKAG